MLSVLLVITMVAQAFITGTSYSFAIIETNPELNSDWQTDLVLKGSIQSVNSELIGRGFSKERGEIKADLIKAFQEIVDDSGLEYDKISLDFLLVLDLFMTLPENDSRIYNVKVVGFEQRMYEAIGLEAKPLLYSVSYETDSPSSSPPSSDPYLPNHELARNLLTSRLKEGDNITLFAIPSVSNNTIMMSVAISDLENYKIEEYEYFDDLRYKDDPRFPPLNDLLLKFLDLINNFPFAFIIMPMEELFSALDLFYETHDPSIYHSSVITPLYPSSQLILNYDIDIKSDVYAQSGIDGVNMLGQQWDKILQRVELTYYSQIPSIIFSTPIPITMGVLYTPHTLESRILITNQVFFVILIYTILLGLPAIILGLFAGNFSINLVKKTLFRQIGIYKTRGMSTRQVLLLLLVDLLVFSIVAVFLGFLLALPLSFLALTSNGNFSFGGRLLPILIPTNTVQVMLILGIFTGLLLRGLTIKRLARIKIRETRALFEDREPYWKRKNIDLIILFWGILGFFFYLSLRTIVFLDIPPFLIFILALLMLPTPIFLLIGGIMLLSRTIPHILKVLNYIGEKIDHGIITLSLKDLSRRKLLVRRAVMVVALGTSLALILAGIPANLLNYTMDNAYYTVGSDYAIQHDLNPQFKNLLYQNLSDFKFELTEWVKISFSVQGVIKESSLTFFQVKILAINSSSFSKAGFYANEYGLPRLGLGGALRELEKNPQETVLISKLSKDLLDVDIPGTITLNLNGYLDLGPFTVADEFSYWPNLISFTEAPLDYNYRESEYSPGMRTLVLVIDLKLYQSLESTFTSLVSFGNDIKEEGYYLKLLSGDPSEFSQSLRKLDINFDSIYNHLPSSEDLNFRSLLGANNGIILYTVIINTLTILLFAAIYQQERWKDMGVERTLGMSRRQLFSFSVLSNTVFSAISLGFGVIMGLLLLQVFMNLFLTFFGATAVPPFRIVFPFNEMILYLLMMTIAIVLGSLIALYLAARRPISNILKVE